MRSGAGFWKGLLTALIELGAFLGALNQGWIADKISRKYSIIVAVVIFIIGSVLQTAAVDYAMLTTATTDWWDRYWHAVDGSSSVHLRNQSA